MPSSFSGFDLFAETALLEYTMSYTASLFCLSSANFDWFLQDALLTVDCVLVCHSLLLISLIGGSEVAPRLLAEPVPLPGMAGKVTLPT